MIAHLHLEVRDRPALKQLVSAMERLSRLKRLEIAKFDRRARAAKVPRLRRLAREAKAEAKRIAADGEASE
jgi:hypothetical protein